MISMPFINKSTYTYYVRMPKLSDWWPRGIKGQIWHLSQLKSCMKLSLSSDFMIYVETKQPVP